MVSVVMVFESNRNRIGLLPHPLCQQRNVLLHLAHQLVLRYAAQRRIGGLPAYITQVIKFAEYAQLAKLRYAGKKHKSQVLVARLERHEKLAHDLSNRLE